MTTNNASARRSKTNNAKMAAAAEKVRKLLDLDTLDDRNRDSLDFHEVSVASLRKAIQIAFEAGYDAAESIR